jgi:flagellar basal body rod protein FlgC
MFHEEDDDRTFDPANPIASFKKMLNNNKVDLVHEAIK